MDKIYLVAYKNKRIKQKGTLVGQLNNDLFHLSIEKKIKESQIHYSTKVSFKYCTIKSNDTPLKALIEYGEVYSSEKSKIDDFEIIEIKSKPGTYYPRIHRPFIIQDNYEFLSSTNLDKLKQEIYNYPNFFPHNRSQLLSSINQLAALKEMLITIFKTIHPSQNNLKTFGNNIKNLLVLSCIEVETQLKGIYKANESTAGKTYNTKKYFNLNEIIHLNEYQINFPFYPELKSISPFKNWNIEEPTKSLEWYDSYNAIKHNGELDFNKATLENAISAICAVAILIRAQYGDNILFWEEQIGGFFRINNTINWELNDKIIPPIGDKEWISKKVNL